MKFNPISGSLWTNEGKFLKTLSCPINATHRDMSTEGNSISCKFCKQSIVSISDLNDEALISLFEKSPSQCVSLSLDSPNLKVIYHALSD